MTLGMAAMMLPGAAPAVVDYARTHHQSRAALLFVAAYVAVWTLFGVAVYTVYRPHGTVAAGIAVLVLVQKLVPPRPAVDVTLALALVAFGVVILITPSSVPGLVPTM
jgi:predicted metal-binding membrane protein